LPAGALDAERASWAQAAADLADSQGRLLLKICGRELLHKTELGGVRVLKLASGDRHQEILAAAARLEAAVAAGEHRGHLEGLLACGFVAHQPNTPGQEVLLSLRQDPAFGPVVVVGVGGTLTEWYGRGSGGRSTLILPARDLTAGP
jgi:acetate---CoA ligase (ADP-forming)